MGRTIAASASAHAHPAAVPPSAEGTPITAAHPTPEARGGELLADVAQPVC